MRCLTPLLVIVIIALFGMVGYNTWQINQLRVEIAAAKVKPQKTEHQISAEKQLNKMLADIRQQTERARQSISRGKVESAKTELNKTVKKLDQASKLSKDMVNDATRGIGGAMSTLRNALDGVSGEGNNGKSGNKKPSDGK